MLKCSHILERSNGDEEADSPNQQGGKSEELSGKSGQLDKSVKMKRVRLVLTHNDIGVPSSANWNPMKPFNNKHQ